ncbi:Urb2 domain-containing protein [Mycena sanguinolenta]|uniref:Urb2 domain-containing protein n=1 Tax=Mycena sanguinolenta TaxID=230812 RepID=A0A8H6XE24_9AGAR|nr:Urb2 domain-containing protein [Mycena sanguinolenta]
MASQAVYHALKAPSDPPRSGGPSKIQIASSAWEDKSLYMPNKGEVISDWILTKLLKDKANPPALNPVLDIQFWTLLSQIVVDKPKAAKHWLLPQLNRVPVTPIVAAFLDLLGAVEAELRVPLTTAVRIQLSTLFIQNHLRPWIVCSSNPTSSHLGESVYVVGTEILFNVDTLRQIHDEEHPIFAALRNIPDNLVHPTLSRIFSSFVQCTRKHRSSLFGQSSGHSSAALTEQVRAACFSFFDSCQVLLNVIDPTILTWMARVDLLTVVGDENLFSSSQADGQMSLQSTVPLVLSVLGSERPDEEASLAIVCLSKLMQIDHDLILKDIPRILPELLHIPGVTPSVFSFLELLLDYHVKTRTMHTHVETLFAALAADTKTRFSNVQQRYQAAFSSALLHPIHLNRLTNCTRKFLTPGQTGQTVAFTLAALQDCWSQISASDDAESGRGSLALTFCFSARLASVILDALPLQALSDLTLQEVNDSINELRSTFLPRALAKVFKVIGKNVAESWTSQILGVAILRLQSALGTPYTDKLWTKVEAASDQDGLLPEMSLELFRMLLKWSSVDEPLRTRDSIDRMLRFLENNSNSESSSSGASCSLTFGLKGKEDGALAILHMLIDRYLPIIDAIASPVQLQWLVKIIFRANIAAHVSEAASLNANLLLLNALSSAQFWELPNLRTAILAFADEATSVLADPHVKPTDDSHATIWSTYRLLLTFPIEFMSRTLRTELIRRAVNGDVLYSSSPADSQDLHSVVAVLRTFIHNVSLYIGTVDQPISSLSRYLIHLIRCNSSSQALQNSTDVTLSLLALHFTALLKSSEQSAEATVEVLRSCLPPDLLSSANDSRVLVHLIETLTKGFSRQSFPTEVQDEICDLERRLSEALVGRVGDMDAFFASEELMNLWLHALLLRRWLKVDGDRLPLIGIRLCSGTRNGSVPSTDELDDMNRTTAFAILAEELHWTPDNDRVQHLSVVLATYVPFAHLVNPNSQARLDRLFSQMCNALPASEFCHLLDLVHESLSDTAHSTQYVLHLVHSAALLLSEHPAGTLKHTQNFLTRCLNTFTGHVEFTNGPLSLRLEVLRLLRQQCSDSPASLRTSDIGCIWSLLSKFLAKSKTHDEATSTDISQEITTIVGALIRLRRDLVALTLPNLGMVLQQLIATIRRPRPQLGAKQTALVTDTLPRWVNSVYPVTHEEGKALARLLETLTTKTTPRSHASTGTERAESLARPFSKHAAYVIKAYIDAMNDPLCMLPPELRKELRPGLFALCSMLNDHNRDAMMVSALDAGGKTIMKNLWTEYEKQKYVGKG